MATKKTNNNSNRPKGNLPVPVSYKKKWAREKAAAKEVARNMNNYKESRATGKKKQEQIVASADSLKFKADAERWAKERKAAEEWAKESSKQLTKYSASRTAGRRKQKEIYSK